MSYATALNFAEKYGSDYTARLLAGLEPGASTDAAVLDSLLAGASPSNPAEDALQRGINRLTRRIDDRSDLANTYLMQAATLPLSTATIAASPLVGYVCDLTRCSLATKPGARTEQVLDDCEAAIAWLTSLASGKVGLPNIPEETGSKIAVSSRDQKYTDTLWETY